MSLLQSATLGDRKELWIDLHRLPPDDRVRFLCRTVLALAKPGLCGSARNLPLDLARRDDSADRVVTNGVYTDLVFLAAQHGLDLEAAIVDLAECVRKPAELRRCPRTQAAYRDALAIARRVRPA